MINTQLANKYCREDIRYIENYDLAIADTTHTWDLHHRDEIKVLPSGIKVCRTRQELIENDRYYNCPTNELIFLTRSDHMRLHRIEHSERLGKKHTTATKKKMSDAHKNKKRVFGQHVRGFIDKFFAQYNKTKADNFTLYMREYMFYRAHNRVCRWEMT